ncbi:hypothetical protein C8J57DRAFT_1287299 [Mycena rebaudengoi]|nr:hypothetical protein C8J57DRAFT_1287299 [Mycena rebaudengoi]
MAPADELPVELLAEILSLSLKGFKSSVFELEIYPTAKAVLRLTQVSRYWRLAAHNSPDLWTRLCIGLNVVPSDAYVAGLTAWLNRSVPLTISLDIKDSLAVSYCDAAGIVDILLPFTHRISSLIFEFSSFSIPINAQTNGVDLATIAPRLRRCNNLEEAHIDIIEDDEDPVPTNWPFTLPHLHSLKFTTTCGVFPFVFRVLTLPALTSLSLSFDGREWPPASWSADEFSQFQLRSPNIQDLTLSYSTLDPTQLISILRSSPAIRTLALFSTPNCIDDTFLQTLRHCESESGELLVPLLEEVLWEEIGGGLRRHLLRE